MKFNIGNSFKVVRYKRSQDNEAHLAFLQDRVGTLFMLWDGEKQLLVRDIEMMEATEEETASFRKKINEQFLKTLATPSEPKKEQPTPIVPTKEVPLVPKKQLSDYELLLVRADELDDIL